MKLATLFREENILIHLESPSLEEAVRELLRSLAPYLGQLDQEKLCGNLVQTEADLPIALGHSVRMPHARIAGIDRLLLALATSQEGFLVAPGRDERVQLVFLILAPKTQSAELLQTMASLARFVHNVEDRRALASTTTSARALRILEESGIDIRKAIVAADLMSTPSYTAQADMTLRRAAGTLVVSREDGLPVVNGAGELLGEISARMLIEIGLPKYMNLITDPKILTDFQPFEAFYRREDSSTVEEIMNRDVLRVAPETPVEIVAHEMLTKHSQRAYVVKEQKLLGVVCRKDIVRKVLCL